LIKYFFFAIVLTSTILFADNNYEITLYEKIFPLIMHKKNIKIYTEDKNKHIFEKSKSIILVNDCNNADII
jgi:hypothetical protein